MVTPERTGAQERQTQAPPLLRVTALPDLQEGWVGGLPGQVCESETQREGSSKLAQDFWEKTLCRGSQPLSAQRQVDPQGVRCCLQLGLSSAASTVSPKKANPPKEEPAHPTPPSSSSSQKDLFNVQQDAQLPAW